jgi:hypothetical protein
MTGIAEQQYRVWIVRYADWKPDHWAEVPPEAEAVEPAEAICFDSDQAAQYIAGFNTEMLRRREIFWAVAVPVETCYEGDLAPGITTKFAENTAHSIDSPAV